MIKRMGIGLFVFLGIVGLVWWAWGRGGGPGVHTLGLSVLNQTLYAGAGPDRVVKLKQGDTVTIRITADEAMEVFLHGYDLEVRVVPGATSTLQFTAHTTGLHPLMIHSLGGDEGSHEGERRVEILLGFVEVSPRK